MDVSHSVCVHLKECMYICAEVQSRYSSMMKVNIEVEGKFMSS